MDFNFSYVYQHSKYQCQISPDSKFIANAVDTTVVIRGHSQDMVVMHVFETNHPVDWMQWSPDGQYIATMNRQHSLANIWSMNDTNMKILLKDTRFGMQKAWWSPDSSSLLVSSDLELRITVWMFVKNEIKYLYQPKIADIGCVPSPDGKYMAVVEKKDNKDYLNLLDGKSYVLLKQFLLDTTDVTKLLWSSDSLFLAVVDNSLYYKVVIYRLDGHHEFTFSAYEHGLGVKSISWHDNILAIGSYDGKIRIINTGSWQLVTTVSQTHIIKPGKHNDLTIYEEYELPSSTLSTCDAKVGYRTIKQSTMRLPLLRPEYNKHDPDIGIGKCDFCQDGSLLATTHDAMPTTLWIWDVRKLEACMILSQMKPVRHFKWNPKHPHTLAMVCGGDHVYIVYQDSELKVIPFVVPNGHFSVQQIGWSADGKTLLLLDHRMYCVVALSNLY